jgi:hypothetical protein
MRQPYMHLTDAEVWRPRGDRPRMGLGRRGAANRVVHHASIEPGWLGPARSPEIGPVGQGSPRSVGHQLAARRLRTATAPSDAQGAPLDRCHVRALSLECAVDGCNQDPAAAALAV